jgi:hypothetical protein
MLRKAPRNARRHRTRNWHRATQNLLNGQLGNAARAQQLRVGAAQINDGGFNPHGARAPI